MRPRDECADHVALLVVHQAVEPPEGVTDHVLDGSRCWCQPQEQRILPRVRLEPRR